MMAFRKPINLISAIQTMSASGFTFVAVDLLRTASSFSLTTVPQASFSSPSLPIGSVSTSSSFRFRLTQTPRFISSSILVSVPHPHLLPNELQPRMTGVAVDPQRFVLHYVSKNQVQKGKDGDVPTRVMMRGEGCRWENDEKEEED
ncbi:hypothetical protein RYX36_027187 [Vicia faba]